MSVTYYMLYVEMSINLSLGRGFRSGEANDRFMHQTILERDYRTGETLFDVDNALCPD